VTSAITRTENMAEDIGAKWTKNLQEREKRDVYKSIGTLVTMNQNYFPYSSQLRLDVTNKHVRHGVTSNNAECEQELYSYQMKPLLLALRMLAVFPVEFVSGT
jgi:hypothetical protein